MINAYSYDPNLVVDGGMAAPYIGPAMDSGRELEGDLRINNGQLEVFAGGCWMMIDTSVNVAMTPDAQQALEWAKKKMQQEKEEEELCKKYPALKTAKDKYEMIKALVEND